MSGRERSAAPRAASRSAGSRLRAADRRRARGRRVVAARGDPDAPARDRRRREPPRRRAAGRARERAARGDRRAARAGREHRARARRAGAEAGRPRAPGRPRASGSSTAPVGAPRGRRARRGTADPSRGRIVAVLDAARLLARSEVIERVDLERCRGGESMMARVLVADDASLHAADDPRDHRAGGLRGGRARRPTASQAVEEFKRAPAGSRHDGHRDAEALGHRRA